MGLITNTKDHLARVRSSSWHYKLAASIWGEDKIRFNTRKACLYWWVRVPGALIAAGFIYVLGGFIWLTAAICGFTPSFVQPINPDKRTNAAFYPHRYSPRHDRYRRLAPWYFLLPLGGGLLAYWLIAYHWRGAVITVVFLLGGLAGCALLAAIGWFVHRQQGTLTALWDRACPRLEIVNIKDNDRQ